MKNGDIDKDLIINTIMKNSQDTIYIKDKESAVIWSSKAHSRLWGVEDPAEVVGKTDFDFFPKQFAQMTYKEEQNIMKTATHVNKIERLIKPDGEVIWLSSHKYPFYSATGEIIGTWGSSRDITQFKEVEEELIKANKELAKTNRQLRVLSAKDSLSGLYNRRYFHEELQKKFNLYTRQREKDDLKDFSLILIDIDNFKDINDSYGHLIGDLAIKHLAEIMLKSVRDSDSCFRHGGDEFALLLLDTDRSKALEVANKLKDIINHTPICYKQDKIIMTTSMGVASFSNATDAEDLINKADCKLYLSKKSGKNIVS